LRIRARFLIINKRESHPTPKGKQHSTIYLIDIDQNSWRSNNSSVFVHLFDFKTSLPAILSLVFGTSSSPWIATICYKDKNLAVGIETAGFNGEVGSDIDMDGNSLCGF
jgi:hypothetical protein